ncbi:Nif3-like dinuclear metal center hexameric protein [Noviherbaspirillum suwonense]|uniref:Dinuclear metal center protein, YbgI/SA1388 family n=1 Tax=Noviherbaspirillum suwonense TaxID=1224511 RepID=A0ABY1QB26_9BURK|nr:Nif3-like dinuclear metal center hexameric protein [Noviherbaspirillum suwonense]SMP66209.1 dinuclear metal center protein, YbgI/SA1388 family [Noviherbaspirillum suwonense]
MSEQSVDREQLSEYLAGLLDIRRIRDFSPNGLQVEGRGRIARLVTGVTASLALIEAALADRADAILVHHGYFWRGEDGRITGTRRHRLRSLLANDLNLYAYHLPLDMHPELGNNAQLGRQLGLVRDGQFGENDLGWLGLPDDPQLRTVGELAARIGQRLGRAPLLIGDPQQPAGRVGWCTGAAQGYLDDAIVAGANTYLSGEISEQTVHLARESGVAYLACGHHATERYGVQALGEHLAARFGIQHRFIDIDNPV